MTGGGLQVEVDDVISEDFLTHEGTFRTLCSEFVESGPSINGVIAKIPFVIQPPIDARVAEFGFEAFMMVALTLPALLLIRRRYR